MPKNHFSERFRWFWTFLVFHLNFFILLKCNMEYAWCDSQKCIIMHNYANYAVFSKHLTFLSVSDDSPLSGGSRPGEGQWQGPKAMAWSFAKWLMRSFAKWTLCQIPNQTFGYLLRGEIWLDDLRVATCAIFRRKVRYVRSICGVRWSALRVRSICCVSIKYEFLFDKSRKISINIM